MSKVDAEVFVKKVKDNDTGIRSELTQFKTNDWPAVIHLGKSLGLYFSKSELQKAVPSDFFIGAGSSPHQGWEK